jgi:hypothetical protein
MRKTRMRKKKKEKEKLENRKNITKEMKCIFEKHCETYILDNIKQKRTEG